MFLLDSNVYIAGFNDPDFGETFRAFHQRNLPQLILSAVVAHELLVGARDRQRIDALERGLLEPFRTRRRIHVPTLATWSYGSSLTQRSFANDLLIAATARELGAILFTRNLGDFELIRRVVPIHFQPPWPATV